MQSDKGGTANKDQEIIALEIEKQLREAASLGISDRASSLRRSLQIRPN